jgi:uncharacterized membrane protein
MDIGPLQMLAVGFTDPQVDGSILNALLDASDEGTIRIVGGLAVLKDEDGEVSALSGTELSEDEAIEVGMWIGALIGLGADGDHGAEAGALLGGMAAADEYEYGMDAEAVATIADDIPAGGAALLLVIAHQWAIPLRDALRASGGILLAQDFLSPEALISLGAEG